jgi:hypothetical protein
MARLNCYTDVYTPFPMGSPPLSELGRVARELGMDQVVVVEEEAVSWHQPSDIKGTNNVARLHDICSIGLFGIMLTTHHRH